MGRIAKRALLGGVSLALLAGVVGYGVYYERTGRFLQSTDDAYLQADYTTIAPKVSGYIGKVLVEDNQEVTVGQVLARIDDSDYRTALDQAKADVTTAEAEIANISAQIDQQHAMVDQASAAITSDQAAVTFAKQDSDRYRDLMRNQVGTVQQAQQTESKFLQATATMQRDRAALVAAQGQITVLETARAKAQTQLKHYQASEHQAELNLSYTVIVSPIDGSVGARSLREGQYVQAGTQLMAVVPLQSVYVVGNFKETQLTDVKPGQPVSVEVDTFPGKIIKGHVDSLAPASGLEFALLPPDNATGNFTKIVQRIPVKIVLDPGQSLAGALRPGMSVEPEIDTNPTVLTATGQAGQKLATR
ncbi:MAG TPA: HlyD family secretion protein [Aliidongia sp.]|nr:HlyD family secretion protein [Aliidongia sp.]